MAGPAGTGSGATLPTEPRPLPGDWAVGELAILAALAETFVRGDATRRAALAAEALDRGLAPEQVSQLRLVLRILQSRPANLFLGGRPVAFRDLSMPDRERLLLRWATSRLPLRRSAFQAYRKLLTFLAYADPGQAVANPRWAAIGYERAQGPLAASPTPIRAASLPPAGSDGTIALEADVVVVGSGAGGGVVAAQLAWSGRSVVVLEAGSLVTEPEMPADELAAFDRLYLDHGMAATWDGGISILAGATVGGGTTVNWATCLPPSPVVRREWTRDHGLDGFDGPELDEDLATLETELGFAAPPNVPPKDDAILRGAASLGLEAAPTRRDAVDCGDCGSCGFGCRQGAKRSGLRAHLAEAWECGARIVPDATVERVLVRDGGAVGVEARLEAAAPSSVGSAAHGPAVRASSARLVVHARQVVVAAGPLRTPGILQRSGLDHPAIGRHLRLHPVSMVAGRFAEPMDMWRGTMQGARSLAFADGPSGDGRGGFVVESAPGHPGLIALAFPWESAEGHAAMLARIRSYAPFLAIVRDEGSGVVRQTRSGRARIEYRVGARDEAALRRGLAATARIARAAGARELVALGTPPAWHGSDGFTPGGEARAFEAFLRRLEDVSFAPNRGSVFSAHQMGTARMGADARDHACDPRGRVRATVRGGIIAGLYVADTSLFPSAVGVNPMVTTMLVARRVARTVLAED
ncbi:MAG: GMC family oxidoreductase N-terminal domain-containing protein [Candidatus Limnocylindrales bacterium]